MTAIGWAQILIFFGVILVLTRPVGSFMYRVFEGGGLPGEALLFKLCGVDAKKEQTWREYTVSMLVFSAMGMLVTYAIERLQGVLPLNPRGFPGVDPALAFNTAASFTTNTNWQAYSGEAAMSYLTQMAGLAWHNFTSAAVGIGIALALARGITRRSGNTLGNFWVDVLRGIVYVLLPICVVVGLVLVSQGIIQSFSGYETVKTLEGATQVIPMGPVASQEAIKELGTNGGGFFNANSAHPFENPTPVTNFIEMLLIFVLPAGITYTYGRMAKDTRQGWALFGAMSFLFFAGVTVAYWAESRGLGNMEGKEVRFGQSASTLFATITTDASCGAVNSMHDSFTALGGLVPLINIQLGEVIFGGVGAGLYGMLIMVLLSVFIAGLMVGRTPELLGKKIEGREMKLAMLYVLIFPLVILGFSAWGAVNPAALSSLNNGGPHGLSEILYAFTSATGNNGSAFAGLNANVPWWNITLGLAMLLGRFLMIVPALAIAGALVGKKTVAPGPGTFPTNGPLFSFLLVSVIIIVGALTFFPALSLGPIVEHFVALQGRTF